MSPEPEAESVKKKLTLSVDEKVIEKAKDLGINLSEVTEGILRGFAFKPDESDKKAEYRQYQELFKVMVPLLQEYSTGVKVAVRVPDVDETNYATVEYYLTQDGRIWIDEVETYVDMEKVPIWMYLEPKEILSNFLETLSRAKERRKDRLAELELAKRIVEAMTNSIKPKTEMPDRGGS